ncbi:MAG: aminoacyl-tRNA hydrolase [Nitrospinota bacterium]
MRLIVGLGNPGRQYRGTRHNMGFAVLDELAAKLGIGFSARGQGSVKAEGSVGGKPVVLAKPLTYMNLSGLAVRELLSALGLEAEDLLVIHDDVDLPLGRLQHKRSGGDAGHLGVRSIIEELGTGNFERLRVGVGRPPDGDVTEYVLSAFDQSEGEEVARAVGRAVEETLRLLGASN